MALRVLAEVEGSWPKALRRWIRQQVRPEATVLYYPHLPKTNSVAYKLCALLAFRPVNDPRVRADYRVFYSYDTKPVTSFPGLPVGRHALNEGCRDISKRKVHEVFERVFGYPLAVDPTLYAGPMAEKADENSVKRSRMVRGPLAADAVRDGYVYERMIDSTTVAGVLEDLRVPVYAGSIPAMYSTQRPTDRLFKEVATGIRLERTEDCFTPEEIELLSSFAAAMGMEYGELDVLRDAHDGRIYVVDANSTSHGPDEGLSQQDLSRYLWALAEAYRTLLERGKA